MPVVFNLRENPVFAPYLEEAENRGRAEGRVEGRAQGINQGVRRALRHLLEKRFGIVPARVHDRLEDASLSQLEQWTERVLEARSLEEVFAESGGNQ